MLHTVSMKENNLFRRLYAKGTSAACSTVAVYARPNHREVSRLGFTVSTRVGKAVVRNRVRRRLREIYRLHEDQLAPGWDIVVVARTRSAEVSFRELRRDLLRMLDKLGIRRNG